MDLTGNQQDFIDLRRVLASKNPILPKILPNFVIRYLEKIIHVKDLNNGLNAHRRVTGEDFLDAVVHNFRLKIQVEGLKNLSDTDRPLLAANHPLGGLDGIALLHTAVKAKGNVLCPVNDLLLNISNLRNYFIPINKHGSNRGNAHALISSFASDAAIVYFPAGLCSRKQKNAIEDLPWQKTFINFTRKYERPVVPVYIDGANSPFFYNLANLRKTLKIKFNIEMLFLVDEMYKQGNKTLKMIFGSPIPHLTFNGSRTDWEWAELLRKYVYTLPQDKTEPFTDWLSSQA